MLKLLLSIFCMIAVLPPSVYGGNSQLMTIECAPELQQSLTQIQKLPSARELIAKVQKEGPFRIQVNRSISEQFGAFWDPDRRIIFVTLSSDRVEGSLIGSILFELHNAISSSKLDYYDSLAVSRKINKESYVEAIERMEYQNSLSTAELAKQGIEMGIFPRGARMPTYPNFEEHFRIQKMGGHSAWIANNYDQLLSSPHYMMGPG